MCSGAQVATTEEPQTREVEKKGGFFVCVCVCVCVFLGFSAPHVAAGSGSNEPDHGCHSNGTGGHTHIHTQGDHSVVLVGGRQHYQTNVAALPPEHT